MRRLQLPRGLSRGGRGRLQVAHMARASRGGRRGRGEGGDGIDER